MERKLEKAKKTAQKCWQNAKPNDRQIVVVMDERFCLGQEQKLAFA